ncbi:MAG: twin-arginine translocation signal domain-containing protein, partial [Candidatus Latescibacteria bacterium]|nr:twin-arginine translocation signal domain-containing protein [Candidatus Latescibacterota bacterium]
MADHTSRRSFLTKSGLAGAAALATSTSPAQAAPAKTGQKVKVGAFGACTYSFWGIWADLLSPRGRLGTSTLNMEISHLWDKDYDAAQKFAEKWGCEAVKNYDDMIGKVDGVACGGLYEVPWQHKMFRPYLEAGMPCYLSRPWSYRKKDMNE